jgi:hypothetical protein
MVIVEILWQIKPSLKEDFLNAWNKKFLVKDRSQLIGEYLSAHDDKVEEKFKSWRIEEFRKPSEDVLTFVNVAIWQSFEAFLAEINRYIPTPGAPENSFVVARYRVVLRPIAWRRGKSDLPNCDSPETE